MGRSQVMCPFFVRQKSYKNFLSCEYFYFVNRILALAGGEDAKIAECIHKRHRDRLCGSLSDSCDRDPIVIVKSLHIQHGLRNGRIDNNLSYFFRLLQFKRTNAIAALNIAVACIITVDHVACSLHRIHRRRGGGGQLFAIKVKGFDLAEPTAIVRP